MSMRHNSALFVERVAVLLAWMIGLAIVPGVALGDGDGPRPRSVFFAGSYDEAHATAKEHGRTLVLYFTAEWCGPCKQMERTTWVDGRVVELLTTKGVVFKIDVDRQGELSRKYGVRAMPTMIAVKDGEVFDRILGGRNPEQMIEWFEGVGRGERSIDAQRRRVEQRKPGEHDVQGRLELARSLMAMRSYAEAMGHLVWLWDHGLEHDPSFVGVRSSFMLSTIKALCDEHPPAMAAFVERRDGAERKLAAGAMDPRVASDFVALNEALEDRDRTLAWFDTNKDDPSKRVLFEAASFRLVPLLLEAERWADAGRLMPTAVERAQVGLPMQIRVWEGAEGVGDEAKGLMLGMLVTQYANEHAALFAAGLEREAIRMAMLVVNHLGNPGRVGLARAALRAGVVRPVHERLLAGVLTDQPEDFAELRRAVRERLGGD